MGWPHLRTPAAWAWPVAIAAGLALVLTIRALSGPGIQPASSAAKESGGIVAAQPDDLAAAARRLRALQGRLEQTREQLAAVQNEAVSRRQQVATLDAMLADDTLTQCPGFLQDETTVRALQKIIREAAAAPDLAAPGQNQLNTAAAVAHERLRRKLEILRDQLLQDAARLEMQAESLRQQLHLQMEEIELLQRQVHRQLQSRLSGVPVPAA